MSASRVLVGLCLPSLSIFTPMLFHKFPVFLWLLKSERRWHTQICNFRCLITCVLQVCTSHDLINAVAARCEWLDGKCQRLLATALKVQHCWTLKTTVDDSRTLALATVASYKLKRDCRRLSLSRATVSDWSINQALCHRGWSGGLANLHVIHLVCACTGEVYRTKQVASRLQYCFNRFWKSLCVSTRLTKICPFVYI